MKNVLALIALLASGYAFSADTTISGLPAAAGVNGTDVLPASQAGTTRKVTAAQIATYVESGLTAADVGLGNVDNTSDATKDAATSTLTNKTVSGAANTLTDIPLATAVTGTLADARLSANVPLLDASNTFSNALNTFSSAVSVEGAMGVGSLLTFPGGFVTAAEPRIQFNETDAGTNLKLWDFDLNASVFTGRTRTDADAAGVNWLAVTRGATTAVSNIAFGNATNNNTFSFLGTGVATFGGAIVADRLSVTGSSITTNGLYLAAGNTVGISTNSTLRLSVSTTAITSTLRYRAPDGSAASPAYFGTADNSSGIYWPGANRVGFSTSSTYRGEIDAAGQWKIGTVGAGLSVAEGTNAKMGTCTLVAGTCTFSTTAVTAVSRIFCTAQSLGTVTAGQGLAVSARTAGTSYTIVSGSAVDTSVVACMIVEPS